MFKYEVTKLHITDMNLIKKFITDLFKLYFQPEKGIPANINITVKQILHLKLCQKRQAMRNELAL